MKKLLIHSLLKSYSIVLVTIIVFFSSILSFLGWQQYVNNVNRAGEQVIERLKEEVVHETETARRAMYDVISDKDKVESIYKYFSLSPSEYQLWLLRHPFLFVKEMSFHDNIANIYLKHEFVTGVDLALISEDTVFTSTREIKSGMRVPAANYMAPHNSIAVNLYDPVSSNLIGIAYISINVDNLSQLIKNIMDIPLSVKIENNHDAVLYATSSEEGIFKHTLEALDFQFTTSIPIGHTIVEMGKLFLLITVGSTILILMLLWLLRWIFLRYSRQVEDLVGTIQEISEKDNTKRINLNDKEYEIYMIGSEINRMLDSLEHSVHQIYLLELAQKDANMKALRAQINPHFMYNTLEFFRMYAVTKRMDELAEMIYTFSSLLRGSITHDKVTTIEEELLFCEKHSYICQIRYPKSIAYSFLIDSGCEKIEIPRFTIQPLVENYFVHGIDLQRKNNAISVKVKRNQDKVQLIIRDNGKGMKAPTLTYIQRILAERDMNKIELPKNSIGIINVHERLLLHFGSNYHISLESTNNEGVTYIITLFNQFGE